VARSVAVGRDSCAPLNWSQGPAVQPSPEKVSGALLFVGARVPVRALFENIEGEATLDDFLEWFPGVTRTQVEAVLAGFAAQ